MSDIAAQNQKSSDIELFELPSKTETMKMVFNDLRTEWTKTCREL